MAEPILTAARLRELLHYDPDTGVFTWRFTRRNAKAGTTAGSMFSCGLRMRIQVDGRGYHYGRVVWLYMTGEWPKQVIDHIDGDPKNNRFANLRDVSNTHNIQNQRRPHADNGGTGVLGTCISPHGGYEARISYKGKNKYLGHFKTVEAAHQRYLEAKRELHPGCTL